MKFNGLILSNGRNFLHTTPFQAVCPLQLQSQTQYLHFEGRRKGILQYPIEPLRSG